jgi:hypothetical protein
MDHIKLISLFRGYYVNNNNNYFLKKYFLLISKNSYVFIKNIELIIFLLGIRDLKNKYSGAYLNKVLFELLKEFDIKYNIIK